MSSSKREEIISSRLSRNASSLPSSGIRKFFDLASSMEDVISLGVGEPDFHTPWVARENAVYSIEKGHTTYTSNQGLLQLREKISERYRKLYGIDYDPENEIIVTVGASQGIDLAMRALLDPGDQVLVPEPSFVAYKPIVRLAGGEPVAVATSQEQNFAFTIEQLKEHVTPKTKAILFGNPSNPTGTSLSRELLCELVEFALSQNIFIISDEIYDSLNYDIEHTCVSTLKNARDISIVLNGFSKTYAMTGWRLGYACAPSPVIKLMTRIHSHTMMCAPTPSQYAAMAVLQSGDPYVNDMVVQYKQRRNLIVDGLNKLGLNCHIPYGAFYAFPSIGVAGMSSEQFAQELLTDEKVAVVPGSVFGESGEGFIRCSYATSLEKIELALERMKKFLSSH